MAADDDFALFDDEHDVEVRTPSIARVLLTLLGAGVLAAIVISVLATLLTANQPSAERLCDGQASCTGLSVEQVNGLTALELPLDSEVMASRYDANDDRILIEATVRLPVGSENPFAGGAYFEVDETELTIPRGLTPFGFYAATGELGALQADAALVDDGFTEVALVRVVRTL